MVSLSPRCVIDLRSILASESKVFFCCCVFVFFVFLIFCLFVVGFLFVILVTYTDRTIIKEC